MKHKKQRISKMVDELINFFFAIGATSINVDVQDEPERFVLTLKCNYVEKHKEKINKLIHHLECPKQEEMEEYYWELAGDCDVDTELTLIGMMTDDVEIDINENTIELVLYRNK